MREAKAICIKNNKNIEKKWKNGILDSTVLCRKPFRFKIKFVIKEGLILVNTIRKRIVAIAVICALIMGLSLGA